MILLKSQKINSLSAFSIYVFIIPIVCVSASSVPREYGEFKLFQTPVTYDLNTSLSITDDNGGGRASGYRIEAVVGVEPMWSDQETDFLLKFHLEVSRLWLGPRKAPLPSSWTGRSSFYVRLTHGAVQTAYLDKRDPLDLLNYKKSIVSLFQFRAIDGETKETDVSGICDVLYESSSLTTIHKTKTRCGGSEPESWSRRTTYSLSAALDALRDVHAHEHVVLGRAGAQLSARASHDLRLRVTEPRTSSATDLEQGLRTIPSNLAPTALTLQPDTQDPEVFEDLSTALESLRELLSTHEAGEDSAGAGGDIPTAMAALRVLPALAAADTEQILTVLRDEKYHALLPALCRMLGLTGTAAAHAAVNEHLQLASRDPPKALSLHYLAGAALASQPAASTVAALLKLAESARARYVSEAAVLAAAALARRDHTTARTVRDFITKALSRCKDDECRIVRVHALGNLRLADSAEALLAHAERGTRGVALAALDALGALPAAMDQTRLERLQVIATRGGRALEVRASALDLLLRRATPAEPRDVTRQLRDVTRQLRHAPHDLRRVLWQRARQLADDNPLVGDALKALDKEDLTWDARALAGTSHVLSRSTGWRLADREARLESTQFAAAGLLRRGVVTLLARAPGLDEEEELAVEVWTRGLEAVAGGSEEQLSALDEGDDAAGDVRGGLRLRVGGVHAPGIVLFDGQAELLGHVWAGTGSAATPALRAANARAPRAAHAHTLLGNTLSYRAGDIKLFAVDAQAQVSLWSRSARASLELRVAGAAHTCVSTPAPGGARLRADATLAAAPSMTLAAHLDFYDGVALCVRAHLADHQHARNVTGEVAAARRAARRRAESVWRAGRTLALGRDNDVACRDLAHADA